MLYINKDQPCSNAEHQTGTPLNNQTFLKLVYGSSNKRSPAHTPTLTVTHQ